MKVYVYHEGSGTVIAATEVEFIVGADDFDNDIETAEESIAREARGETIYDG